MPRGKPEMASAVGERMVTPAMKPPIIVIDKRGHDLSIYSTVEEAENHLEAIDVKENEYTAFDAEGRSLKLHVLTKKVPIIWGILKVNRDCVILEQVDDKPTHADSLRAGLTNYLKEKGVSPKELVDLSIELLITKAMET